MTSFLLNITPEQKGRYLEAAKLSNRTLSQWMRDRLDEAAESEWKSREREID